MNGTSKSLVEIRREGMDALRERLGLEGMYRFLRLYDAGSGDYTEERKAAQARESVDEIADRIERRRTNTPV